jgi:hypothetical protein
MMIYGTLTKDNNSMDIKILNVHLRPPLAMGDDKPGIMGNMKAYFITSGSIHKEELHGHLKNLRYLTKTENNNNNNLNKKNSEKKSSFSKSKSSIISDEEEQVEFDINTIVVGDFNEGSMGGGYQYLESKNYRNCLDISSDKNTWYWPLPMGLTLWGSYDHIFLSPSFEVLTCEVMKDYINVSDHIPVIASILQI